ncbi:hypothetical protein CYMTET_17372 [Cymbomonas tetramitiformis]|uniref:LNR domain-containing protein n=1 Tax=Cymbomonas tetramitiformis TaxID=36881 RepID=A0AAE0L712_9CHLO|nr:hypothetical protein CYMTET_17372 [Cymbomonas tetramitiformis]
MVALVVLSLSRDRQVDAFALERHAVSSQNLNFLGRKLSSHDVDVPPYLTISGYCAIVEGYFVLPPNNHDYLNYLSVTQYEGIHNLPSYFYYRLDEVEVVFSVSGTRCEHLVTDAVSPGFYDVYKDSFVNASANDPECTAAGCPEYWQGDGSCDTLCYVSECAFDKSDCIQPGSYTAEAFDASCGCEIHGENRNFCTHFESGECAPCSYFDLEEECSNSGYPPAGVADCIKRCFGNRNNPRCTAAGCPEYQQYSGECNDKCNIMQCNWESCKDFEGQQDNTSSPDSSSTDNSSPPQLKLSSPPPSLSSNLPRTNSTNQIQQSPRLSPPPPSPPSPSPPPHHRLHHLPSATKSTTLPAPPPSPPPPPPFPPPPPPSPPIPPTPQDFEDVVYDIVGNFPDHLQQGV